MRTREFLKLYLDYSNAIHFLMNDFAHPLDELAYMYHEERDTYYVQCTEDGISGYINWPGPIVRRALPIVKSGVTKWT
jgi:hypothetical protein